MQQFNYLKSTINKNEKSSTGNYRAVQNIHNRKIELFDLQITSLEPFLAEELKECKTSSEAQMDELLQ